MRRSFIAKAMLSGALALGLAACDSVPIVGEYPTRSDKSGAGTPTYETADSIMKGRERKTIFGDGVLFGGSKRPDAETDGVGIGVNTFLWRASLDTTSFMPVMQADPFGGVILTDWHAPNGSTAERFKLNVYILGRSLRADGVRVSVFRQVSDGQGGWRDAGVTEGTASQIEDAILTRARQMRNESQTR